MLFRWIPGIPRGSLPDRWIQIHVGPWLSPGAGEFFVCLCASRCGARRGLDGSDGAAKTMQIIGLEL